MKKDKRRERKKENETKKENRGENARMDAPVKIERGRIPRLFHAIRHRIHTPGVETGGPMEKRFIMNRRNEGERERR